MSQLRPGLSLPAAHLLRRRRRVVATARRGRLAFLPRPRSLRNKLALLFFGITAAAFAVLFFFVVPQLESRLVDRRLEDLARASRATVGAIETATLESVPEEEFNNQVRAVADEADAIVTVVSAQLSFGRDAIEQVRPYVISDSRAERRVDQPLAIARDVFEAGTVQTRTVSVAGERFVRVARPVEFAGEVGRVVVYSRSIDDVEDSVGLIRTQVILATALALAVALVGGYLVAQALSRRVRRLEGAAEQVAGGRFPGPLPVDSDDELGQLTRTFNEMQAQLAQADRTQKEFIATASHELRTPIMSLGGFVELLLDEDIDRDTREEFLRTMREQVERLQKLSVDLLDLSRLDAGSIELRAERVDLAELVRGVAAEFRPATRERPGQVVLETDGGPVEALCHPDRTAQIVRILLDNALRHTPAGTPVSVSAGSGDGAASIVVADRGPGLESEAAEQVFERFYTADAARGSGLGLAIAKELAELMSARITVRSRPGETAFTVELPAAG